jgi:imidazolonepropionase-like amidohydrolase
MFSKHLTENGGKMKILVKNVNVFDGMNNKITESANIVIEDNLVTDITQEEIPEEGFDDLIDARGNWAIPGLIDAHVHIGATAGFAAIDQMTTDEVVLRAGKLAHDMLYRGFTTVRDVASPTVGLKKVIDDEIIPGPRIYPSEAAVSQTCGHSDYRQNRAQRNNPIVGSDAPVQRHGFFRVADGVPEVLLATREQLFKGASQIKMMAGGGASSIFDPLDTVQYTLEEMRACVQAAEDYGTYVCTHIHTNPAMLRAAEAGIKCFEHASLMNEEVAEVVKDKGIWLCPQYAVAEMIAERKIPFDSEIQYQKTERVGKGLMQQAELVEKMGMLDQLVYGTDVVGTLDVHRMQPMELGWRAKRFGAFQALKHATGNCHELFKLCTYQDPYPEGEVGTLRKGSFADLLILKENPMENPAQVENASNILLIMKDGKLFKDMLETPEEIPMEKYPQLKYFPSDA